MGSLAITSEAEVSSRAVMVPVVCSCAWTGSLPTRGDCPGCGHNSAYRVTSARIVKMREIVAWNDGDRSIAIEPAMVQWLTDSRHRMMIAAPAGEGARALVRNSSWHCYRLTDDGQRVLLAAQLADREAGVRREIAGATAVRHAEIEEP